MANLNPHRLYVHVHFGYFPCNLQPMRDGQWTLDTGENLTNDRGKSYEGGEAPFIILPVLWIWIRILWIITIYQKFKDTAEQCLIFKIFKKNFQSPQHFPI